MTAYYNEIEPYAAEWLRRLIAAGHIAAGDVDERDIRDIRPDELRGYTQCHFFAGIGVWSYALRAAGWPDDRPVWTGSCPCQPFSQAGKGGGFADERHLWPSWFHLISQLAPTDVFGEQVASADGLEWLDLVQADMEGTGYAFGAVVTPAAGCGAPHARHRTYFVANAPGERLERRAITERQQQPQPCGLFPVRSSDHARELGDAGGAGLPARQFDALRGPGRRIEGRAIEQPSRSFWTAADWIYCRDDKWRPVEPGTFPLAHGATARVGRLRAYGNAINAEQAKGFISAYLGDQGRCEQ